MYITKKKKRAGGQYSLPSCLFICLSFSACTDRAEALRTILGASKKIKTFYIKECSFVTSNKSQNSMQN